MPHSSKAGNSRMAPRRPHLLCSGLNSRLISQEGKRYFYLLTYIPKTNKDQQPRASAPPPSPLQSALVVQAVSVIAQGYPRGRKQLIGPFKSLFGPTDAAAWFGSRGVRLKTEEDGRMFPVTDDSQTIIDCLEGGLSIACSRETTLAR